MRPSVNLRPVARILGRLVVLLALAEAVPVVCCLVYGEADAARVFVATSLLTLAAGVVLMLLGRGGGELYRREAILIVVGGWAMASLFGALPYLGTGLIASPVDALFESASGFTTTGASVLTDIEVGGRGILFWRSFTQWLGGMGIVVLFVALLPEIIPGARFLFSFEVPGPSAETLHPRVRDTAIVLWRLYLGLTAAETVLLLVLGLDLYDALTLTFSTLSTGGFSPYNASVAAFQSRLVELVVVLFMVLAGVNFSLYYAVWKRRRWRLLGEDTEVRLYVGVLAAAVAVLVVELVAVGGLGPGRAALEGLFQAVSITTTTGFATADFDTWPVVSRALLIALMFMGGCTGSTAGSMKVSRMIIGLKYAWREVRYVFSPNAVRTVTLGGSAVPETVVKSVSGFFILFMTAWGIGTLLLAIGGDGILTAATASIATLGNIGPGLEAVGPTANYAGFAAPQKLLMVVLMLLGRLEVYAIAAIVTPRFWRL